MKKINIRHKKKNNKNKNKNKDKLIYLDTKKQNYTLYLTRHSYSTNNYYGATNSVFRQNDPFITIYGILNSELLSLHKRVKRQFNNICYVNVSLLLRTWITATILYLGQSKLNTLTLLVSPFLKEKDIRFLVGYRIASFVDVGNFNDNILIQLNNFVKQIIFLLKYTYYLPSKIRKHIHNKYINKQIIIYFSDLKYYKIIIGKHNIKCIQHLNDKNKELFKYDILIVNHTKLNDDIDKTINLNELNDEPDEFDININYINKLYKNVVKQYDKDIEKINNEYKLKLISDDDILLNYDKNLSYNINYMYKHYDDHNINSFLTWLNYLKNNKFILDNVNYSKFKNIFTLQNGNIHCVSHSHTMTDFKKIISKPTSNDKNITSNDNNWTLKLNIDYICNKLFLKNAFIYHGIKKPNKKQFDLIDINLDYNILNIKPKQYF